MNCKNLPANLFLLFTLFFAPANSQSTSLPRSTPEAQGVSSKEILDFIDAANKSKTEFHSFMLLRHGKVVAEGWWNPYRADLKHTLYSTSKSFTATAIGFAVTENKLTVNDKVISFFPNDLPDSISPYLAALTVKDVLSMSDGQDPDPTNIIPGRDSNWVRGFLSTPIVNEPGTKFLYNSMGTYMLSAIVQKVTGEKVIDYLRPRLFEPLGISGMDWETDPKGINTGGWGLRLKTEDMAKFGQLFLQKGSFGGKEVIPSSWIEEASSTKIMQDPDAPQSKKDSSDWLQGYCYQMWRCRNNAYRGDGAFGQYIIIMPEKDAVLAVTAETPDMQEEINLVWKYLLPAMKDNVLAEDKENASRLKKTLASLSVPAPAKSAASPLEKSIAGTTYSFEPNDKHIQSVSFQFSNNTCYATVKNDTASFKIGFGSGKWHAGETTMHGPYLVERARRNLAGLDPFKIDGCYNWTDKNTLSLTLRYIESPHTATMICHFDGDKLTSVNIRNSFDYGKKELVLKGQ
ncbi:serine hydrolase [Danxiaibacter flavus]|uniref:Serine hydrolase n=1 Tax=Danxiaibacter flavus TaxID=3049108 RepID=A0ABV3ZAW3_9BACT|nr:serine hydrolase [Chitinophagaceae bacterium DXS]